MKTLNSSQKNEINMLTRNESVISSKKMSTILLKLSLLLILKLVHIQLEKKLLGASKDKVSFFSKSRDFMGKFRSLNKYLEEVSD